MASLIDPTVTGNYPVILGDSLRGKPSNDIFTGIRYNHKPALSSEAPSPARLKPSIPGKTTSYDLAYNDDDGAYAYAGTRTTSDNQYMLYFDPERKAFILDKVDSTFHMNVTRLPGNSDPDKLSRQYPHLESEPVSKTASKEKPKAASKARAKSPTRSKEPKRKPDKKPTGKMELPVPQPEKPKSKTKAPRDDEEEDDDDDGDGGLLVEYPGANLRARQTDFSPAFPPPRRFDDFMDQRESDGGDADAESDDEPDMDFKLPSPVNNHAAPSEPMDEDKSEDEVAAASLEDDLEKEMEIAFEDLENSQEGSRAGDESEISEED